LIPVFDEDTDHGGTALSFVWMQIADKADIDG
jgi:hypothetical protein